MRRNRAINNANDGHTSPEQGSQEVLIPNPDVDESAQARNFMPELSTPEAISAARVHAFEKPDHWGANYESHIPRGPRLNDSAMAGETNATLRSMGGK